MLPSLVAEGERTSLDSRLHLYEPDKKVRIKWDEVATWPPIWKRKVRDHRVWYDNIYALILLRSADKDSEEDLNWTRARIYLCLVGTAAEGVIVVCGTRRADRRLHKVKKS
jgi:hypothetical protein